MRNTSPSLAFVSFQFCSCQALTKGYTSATRKEYNNLYREQRNKSNEGMCVYVCLCVSNRILGLNFEGKYDARRIGKLMRMQAV